MAFLVPTVLGLVTWIYNMSIDVTRLKSQVSSHTEDIQDLETDVKQTYAKYDKIIDMLIEIKVSLGNKKDRDN